MDYRRARKEGVTYFFIVNLAERSCTLLVDRADDLRNADRLVELRRPFRIRSGALPEDWAAAPKTMTEYGRIEVVGVRCAHPNLWFCPARDPRS